MPPILVVVHFIYYYAIVCFEFSWKINSVLSLQDYIPIKFNIK